MNPTPQYYKAVPVTHESPKKSQTYWTIGPNGEEGESHFNVKASHWSAPVAFWLMPVPLGEELTDGEILKRGKEYVKGRTDKNIRYETYVRALQDSRNHYAPITAQLRENIIHRDLEYGKTVSAKNDRIAKLEKALKGWVEDFEKHYPLLAGSDYAGQVYNDSKFLLSEEKGG